MLVFRGNGYEIDPNMLGIGCLAVLWNRDKSPSKTIAKAELMWLYYMYNPHSTFREYSNKKKSEAIVESIFPSGSEWHYVPENDKELDLAILFYRKHVRTNPLWGSVESLKEAMFNMAAKIADEKSSPNEVRTARMELDELPKSLKKMQKQAENEDSILQEEDTGERNIKKGERLPIEAKR